MISRRTAIAIAKAYGEKFVYLASASSYQGNIYKLNNVGFYDFLFEHDYSAWFCNKARSLSEYNTREVQDFIMKLHTGETQAGVTPDWSWEKRQQLGQEYLRDLAEDILNDWSRESDSYSKNKIKDKVEKLRRSLELDGYTYSNARLLAPESDVLDTKEESGAIEFLYTSLALDNKQITFNHLRLSEEHYLAGRWSDSISNSRNFLESILREIAVAHSSRIKKLTLPKSTYEKPVLVRDYLEREGLLETKEKEALAKSYGLLSSAAFIRQLGCLFHCFPPG